MWHDLGLVSRTGPCHPTSMDGPTDEELTDAIETVDYALAAQVSLPRTEVLILRDFARDHLRRLGSCVSPSS